ncbi:DUF3291 domain-containing protein [Albimonas sp. CAU 1670]|uniref:DUF3291 domain-containing protein n=1 Tax=Albimonas sp. CAU 1670 TaxID=3032599 RepID=UPI0023DB7E18|nr:DUF3291 domain-containing protein [Albimonas sp. CAU 1670]MDF2232685.1 DUF3291 domain-containing protein [Albimonas sp. CAU 1670]
MQPAAHHLAAFNLGRLLHDWDDARVAPFKDALDRVNAVGERSPGFVWRLDDVAMEAAQLDPAGALGGDPRIASALSVWESVEALERFVFRTVHGRFYARGPEWFEPWATPRLVMWWVPVGHRPSVEEGVARLRRLEAEGDTDEAFGWSHLEQARLWKTRGCGAAEAA